MARRDRFEWKRLDLLSGRAAAGALVLAGATAAVAQPLPPLPPQKPPPAPLVIERPANVSATALRTTTPNSITFLLAKTPVTGVPNTWNVEFREEATQPEYATRNGGGSASGAAAVDCARRQFQLRSFTLFSANNLHGQTVLQLYPRTQWQLPGPETLIWRVVELTCAGSSHDIQPRATRRTPATTNVPDAATPATAPAQAPQQPAPAPSPAAAAPSTVSVGLRGVQQGGYWVQVGASNSADLAAALLTKLDAAGLLRGQGRQVKEALVHGAKTFRSLVGAFPDRHAAAQFCESLSLQGHPCFVRAD